MSKSKYRKTISVAPLRHILRASILQAYLNRAPFPIASSDRIYWIGYSDALEEILDLIDSHVSKSDSDSSQEVR